MPSSKPPYFDTVYYSNFWYSRFYRPLLHDFDGNIVKDEISHHKFRMRILTLFFDKIYIPRTHLVTFRSTLQQKIDGSIFDDYDFGFLFERDRLRISSFPGLDEKQDNERIIGRSAQTKRVIYPDDPSYLRKIPITDVYEIDSLGEANSNTLSFPEYAETISINHPDIARKLNEIIKQSQIDGIPFFHEDFLSRIREEFDDDVFERLWRETNSIYLTTGGVGQDSLIAYFNEELESTNFRYEPFQIDRYLFSPSSLYMFLMLMLGQDAVAKLVRGDINRCMGFLGLRQYRELLDDFHRSYQDFVALISFSTIPLGITHDLSQATISTIFDRALHDRFRQGSKLVASLIDDVGKISHAADVDGSGIVSGVIGATARYGHGVFQTWSLRRRFPGIVDFINMLKGYLQG